MTITYSLSVSSSTFLGFFRLLLRWKGSIWKSIWPEFVCWLCTYYALSFSYRKLMRKNQQILFEDICMFFHAYSDYIPITFMLGFYVSAVFNRWNEMFTNLGWIDSPALLIATILRGKSEEARIIRRNIVRYLVLVQAMVYRDISAPVKKRFPTMDHLVTAGIMTAEELKEFDSVETEHIKYWTPIQWAFLLARRARDQGMIESDIIYKIRQYRVNVLTLTLYDWVPIPLVYTQVVNLAVRLYFVIALFARQFLKDFGGRNLGDHHLKVDIIVPVMTILQFFFYMGWIKVAEVLLNPMGEDDDDFETNWIIDRNLQCGLMIVDECYGREPPLERDQFWERSNAPMLYTKETADRPQNPMMGSCNDAQQREDALLLQPRRRRLMGVNATTGGGNGTDRSGEAEEQVVQVQNHNPKRRISVVQNTDGSEGGRKTSKFIETMRRKFSRSSGTFQSRKKASSESGDFERGNSTRVSVNSAASTGSGPQSVQNFLWGAKRTTNAKPTNGEMGKTSTKSHCHVHFDLNKSGQKEEATGGGKTLAMIAEEETEMGRTEMGRTEMGRTEKGRTDIPTPKSSLGSASSTSSSAAEGKEKERGGEDKTNDGVKRRKE
ncbi:hypothetical protein niasHS_003630 [Heterodera schachtii]|uniref:Bestrophin homolog n=1 Tax=Heterodera schachtii TaxID=97005 RepID=A0ABD2KH53_HETSC